MTRGTKPAALTADIGSDRALERSIVWGSAVDPLRRQRARRRAPAPFTPGGASGRARDRGVRLARGARRGTEALPAPASVAHAGGGAPRRPGHPGRLRRVTARPGRGTGDASMVDPRGRGPGADRG